MSSWIADVSAGGVAMALALGVSLAATMMTAFVAVRRRATVARRLLVVALSAGAWVALWLTLVPPRVSIPAGEVVLVTPGATVSDLESVSRLDDVFVLEEALRDAPLASAVAARAAGAETALTAFVTLPDDIALHRAVPRRLRIAGAGLTAAQWRASDYAGAVEWFATPAVAGVSEVDWSRTIAPGEALAVALGVPADDRRSYRLNNPFGEPLDEAPATDSIVRLMARQLPPGRHVLAVGGGDAGGVRPLPVEVVAPLPARVLMLQSAPSFEWRALQRWVADSGSPLAVRTRVSRDRFVFASANRDGAQFERFDTDTLADFDLVIADVREWSAIGAQAQAAILGAVAETGAGLLVLLRDADADGAVRAALGGDVLQPADAPTEVALTPDYGDALPDDLRLTKSAYRIAAGVDTLLRAADGRALAASVRRGAGRVAVMLLLDTHRMVTTGHEATFAALWQSLVGRVARADERAAFDAWPDLPAEGWITRLCVAGGAVSDTLIVRDAVGRVELALAAQPWLPGRRCAWFWPRTSGWHELDTGGAAGAVYVFDETDWRDVRLARRVRATRAKMDARASAGDDAGSVARPVPRQWLFPFAILFASLLWLEQRLAGAGRVSVVPS